MSDAIVQTVVRTGKTTAVLSAVVFLLSVMGCRSHFSDDHRSRPEIRQNSPGEKSNRQRPVRKRAYEYSRIPRNYPATWQTSTIGN